MNVGIQNLKAKDIMSRVVVVVPTHEKVEDAAELMTEHEISAVPVVHESGVCVGILTSQNIVAFESIRKDVENESKHGYFFDMARYGVEDAPSFAKIRFDEVDHHMNRDVVAAGPEDPVGAIAEQMCAGHSHHAVIFHEDGSIVGIVSSLDILAACTSRTASP